MRGGRLSPSPEGAQSRRAPEGQSQRRQAPGVRPALPSPRLTRSLSALLEVHDDETSPRTHAPRPRRGSRAVGGQPRAHAPGRPAPRPLAGVARANVRGPLALAAGEGVARGREVPRGGERLHRGDDRRPEAVPRGPLRGDAGPDQADRPRRSHARRPLLLLPPDGRGPAVPDPLPQARGAGRGFRDGGPRGGAPRPERDGEGPAVPVDRRVRSERRRRAAPVLHRRHRLPSVQALRQGPEDGRGRGAAGRAGHQRGLGRRQPDRLLRDRARGHEAPGHPVAPRDRRRAGEGLRGDGRALPDRGRADEGQEVRRPRQRVHRHLGTAPPPRGGAGRRAPAGPAPREGAQVRRRAPRRHALHPDEQGREELPPRHGAARRSLARELEAPRRAPAGRAPRRRRGVPGLPRRPGEAGRPQPPARPLLRRRKLEGGRLPRARLHRLRLGHAGVRLEAPPLRLPEPRHPLERLRLRHGGRDFDPPEAGGGARRLRPRPLRVRAPLGHRPRRREGPDQHRLPEGLRPRRQGAAVALRLRLLRGRACRPRSTPGD